MLCFIPLFHTDVREVFDLFDFWDGRDGLVDGAKVGDLLRCCALNPTNKLVQDNGGTKKLGIIARPPFLKMATAGKKKRAAP